MTFIGLSGGYFTLFLGGMGLTLILLKSRNPINTIEYLCLSWLLGVGIVSLSLWLGGIRLSGAALQSLVAVICLALGIVGWRTRQLYQIRFSVPRPDNAAEWALATLLVVEIATIFFVSLKHTLGWDGLLNWEIKARYAFLNSGVLPQS